MLALLGMMITALTLSMLPALLMQLLDSTFINKELALIKFISLAIIMLFIVHSVANYIGDGAINVVGNKFGRDLHLAMFNKLLSLPEKYCAELTKNNLNTRFIVHLNTITHTSINIITILIKDSLTMIGLLAWMFYLNWELALLILLITSAIILISRLINGYLSKTSDRTLQTAREVAKAAFDSIKNYQIIKLHGGQTQESERFMSKAEQMYLARIKQNNAKALGIALAQAFIVIILIAITHLITQQPYNNETTPGAVASLIIAALMLVLSLKRVSQINHYLLQGQHALANIFSLLDQKDEEDTGTATIKHCHGELIFDKVSFCCDTQTQPVLNDISLTIKPGEIVVFSGMTESGKTVFINLILRFLYPTNGRILLDGHDLASLKLTSLHESIALIPQKSSSFNDTAAINIAYGAMKCANEAQITAAAQAAHAIDFIREMPEGLQTIIGEYGVKLTEIQCQHIAIARALLKNSPILILDEIPKASNSKADHNLQEALNTLIQGRTTLIITQHPTTLAKIDRIFILKNGSMTEGHL